jgi:hypothetical protein
MKEFCKSPLCRRVLGLVAFALLLLAFVHAQKSSGFALGQHLLLWSGVSCPMDTISETQVESLRQEVLPEIRGTLKAPSYPALDWSLVKVSEKNLRRQLNQKGFNCEAKAKAYTIVECKKVWAKNENIVADKLAFVFNSEKKLIAVEVFYRQLSSQYAIRHLQKVAAALKKELGPPTYQMGNWTPDYFRKEMNSSIIEYKYQDYLAKVTATRLPRNGVAIYEQYLMLD